LIYPSKSDDCANTAIKHEIPSGSFLFFVCKVMCALCALVEIEREGVT